MSKKKIKEKKEDNNKEIKKESKQDSEIKEELDLEKEIEKTESQEKNKVSVRKIEANEFHEFIKPFTESISPVLKKIEIPKQESLEQNISSAPIIQEKKDEKSKNYSTTSNEPNYSSSEKIKYQTNIEPPILKPTKISEDLPRQELLEPRIRTQTNLRPKMVDTGFIEEKTRLPFEKDDKKYKEFRL
jgi:hypothetical protein